MSELIHRTEAKGDSPLVLNLPHSGLLGLDPENQEDRKILDNCLKFFARAVSLMEWDPGNCIRSFRDSVVNTIFGSVDVAAPRVMGFADQTDHHRVWTDVPRALLDVNRLLSDVDRLSVEDSKRATGSANGLIWRSTAEVVENRVRFFAAMLLNRAGIGEIFAGVRTERILVRPFTEKEFNARFLPLYQEYLNAVKKAQEVAKACCGFSVIFSGHTFPNHLAGKLAKGHHAGAYLIGPQARRGSVSNNPAKGKKDIMGGTMPDAFLIADFNHETGKPRWCHPMITQIIEEEFEEAELFVTHGFGPFQGDNGLESQVVDPKNGHHAVAVELVSHELEPDRIHGSLRVCQFRVEYLRPIYQRIFDRLAALTPYDLQMTT
ncbi:MAG: N-formylglutamate amidohydrolase [Candidatus Peregrinibacteria bacterium]